MPIDFIVVRCQDGAFRVPTQYDDEQSRKFKVGTAYRMTATVQSARSLRHHRLYWGGLLGLAMDYWEPSGGLITSAERKTLANFAAWLDKKGGNSGAITKAHDVFLSELEQSRAQRIESPVKRIEDLHEFVKREAGYVEYFETPSGVMVRTKSINFNAMTQEEFNEYYQKAFSVIWRYILHRAYQNETDAQNAIDQLLAMG